MITLKETLDIIKAKKKCLFMAAAEACEGQCKRCSLYVNDKNLMQAYQVTVKALGLMIDKQDDGK